jgi:hypothetical protein
MRKSGLAKYLEDGKRVDSKLARNQKDKVVPLYGSLKLLKKAEVYTNEKKSWSNNYEHIMISFSDEDIEVLEELSDVDYQNTLRDISTEMIKHRTSGYDLNHEVIAYAELHDPKVKQELNARTGELQKRRKHIHIGISYLNPLSDTKLQTTFYNNSYISDTIDKYIAKKHGLTYVTVKPPNDMDVDAPSQMTLNRNILKEATKGFLTKKELYTYLDLNGIKYDFTNKKTNIKQSNIFVYNDKGGKIHLRGKDFSNIEIMHNETLNDKTKVSYIKELNTKTLQELGDILETYYKTNRIPIIDKRRSQESKALLNDIYAQNDKDNANDKVNAFSSLQAKIFYTHYKHLVTTDLKGYFVDTKLDNEVKFIHKKKNIEVTDLGDKIISNSDNNSKNLEEKVKLMIDIATAKGWDLSTLRISGSDAFKKESYRQIANIIKQKKETLVEKKELIKEIPRPKTVVEYLAKEIKENKAEKTTDLKGLKEQLSAKMVLDYAVDTYKLDLAEYELTNDNKINNTTNKQKPKNVIDFFKKEANLTSAEAIAQCQALFKKQPLAVDLKEKDPVQVEPKPIKLKPKQRISDAERKLYKHINEESRRKRPTTDGVRTLSSVDLVSEKKSTTRVLLSPDERNHIRTNTRDDIRVQPTRDRTDKTPIKSRAGELNMPLGLSINKSGQLNALSGWEAVEVKTYSQLSTLMKQYPYSAARFDKKRDASNVSTFNNILIFDIDNDPNDRQMSMEEAKVLLESKGVSAMILPSKNHQLEKFTHSGKSKGIKERYRIVIPTKHAIRNDTDKETYKEFQKLMAKDLGLEGAVDTGALSDKARYYYASLLSAVPIIAKGKIKDISSLENKAIQNIQEVRVVKEAQRVKIEQIRANIDHYRVSVKNTSNHLTYVDAEQMMALPINQLILNLEGGEQKEEGSYSYIKTNTTKYSIIDNKLAHDFKNDMTYNPITYLQMQYETNNLNKIARELEKSLGGTYIRVNTQAVKTAILEALESSVNDKALEEKLKRYFSCEYCKLEGDTLNIADQKIKLKTLGMGKQDLIHNFIKNRKLETIKKEESPYSPSGM